MAMFVGLVNADGYISITNANGYIRLQLIIALHMRDVEMLNHIQSVLGVGRVNIFNIFNIFNIYPANDTAKLTISKTDLQEIIFPLLNYHNIFFLTNARISQYELAKFILESNLILFSEIPAVNLVTQQIFLPTTALGYYQLPFFFNWVVGLLVSP